MYVIFLVILCALFNNPVACCGRMELNYELNRLKSLNATGQCQPIGDNVCGKGISYNMTRFPNALGHENESYALNSPFPIVPVINLQCSLFVREFLCALFVPKCEEDQQELRLPSRYLCEKSKAGCAPVLVKYGMLWPTFLECSQYPAPGVPGPVDLIAVSVTPNLIKVKWNPPSINGENITKYDVMYCDGEGLNCHKVETNHTNLILQSSKAYHVYNITVVADNGFVKGEASNTLNTKIITDIPAAPPQNVDIYFVKSTSISVSWDPPPPELQNGIIQGYVLKYKLLPEAITKTVQVRREAIVINELRERTSYHVRVAARTSAGVGPYSRWRFIRTPKLKIKTKCPNGWITGDVHCYYLSRDKLNWFVAKMTCSFSTIGGRLVEIRTEKQNEEVKEFARESGEGNFWIGLTDMVENGHFTYDAGSWNLTFSDWSRGSSDSMDENCVLLKKHSGYEWHVTKCSNRNYFICEKDMLQ